MLISSGGAREKAVTLVASDGRQTPRVLAVLRDVARLLVRRQRRRVVASGSFAWVSVGHRPLS